MSDLKLGDWSLPGVGGAVYGPIDGGRWRRIDPVSWDGVVIGQSGTIDVEYWSGGAQLPDGRIFGCVQESKWYRFYEATQTAKLIVESTLARWRGILPAASGIVYGVTYYGYWYSFNPDTGTHTRIDTSSIQPWWGAFQSATTGVIYGITLNGKWYTFNESTGVHTVIAASTSEYWVGVFQGPDGTMHGLTGDGKWYTFNESTGTHTLRATNPFIASFKGGICTDTGDLYGFADYVYQLDPSDWSITKVATSSLYSGTLSSAFQVSAESSQGYHDILLDSDDSATYSPDLIQRIDTRLRMVKGEHWLRPDLGVPLFSDILVRNPDTQVIRQGLLGVLLGVNGVKSVDSLEVDFKPSEALVSVSYTVTGTDTYTYSGTTEI